MEHLSLEIFDLNGTGSKYANLPDDTTITITETSEIFGSGDVWTFEFTLNTAANAHIFGTAGEMHGSRLHDQIDRRRARLWVEGEALFLGYLRLGDEAEVDGDGNVSVSFESGSKTFSDLIEGAKANQVPLMGDIELGMALWRKRAASYRVKLAATIPVLDSEDKTVATATGDVYHSSGQNLDEWFDIMGDGELEGQAVQEYPRMVFPKGKFTNAAGILEPVDCINTDDPYSEDAQGTPTHPYCNIALCYQKQGYEKKDSNGAVSPHYDEEPEAQRGYEYMPANRVNSAPCFFVIYWLRALMRHLNIYIEENQMLGVEDLKRLFFVNTNCAYEEPDTLRNGTPSERYGRYKSQTEKRLIPEYISAQKIIDTEESGFVGTNVIVRELANQYHIGDVTLKVREVEEWNGHHVSEYKKANSYFHKAYATSDCFPDVDISEVISALENGFGIRFIFSDEYKRVRIVLLRNIFRNTKVQKINCDIVGEEKVENSIRGFRMTYGDSDDTHFYYKGFADKRPHKKEIWQDNSDKHDYSKWKLDAEYGQIIRKISAFDKTCYVTPETGNAYGIKVDKDAKRYQELHPSLFEYAGFMDAEDGDCTGEEETIKTINVGFTPAIMNDLNMEEERKGSREQRFALFVDDTMRPRRPDLQDGQDYNNPEVVYDVDGKLYAKEKDEDGNDTDTYVFGRMMNDGIVKPGEFAIRSDMFGAGTGAEASMKMWLGVLRETFHVWFDFDGHLNEGYRLYLQDNYEPNDNGVSPVETHDWGLTLGIMRGSGGDMYVRYSGDPDDLEGNDTWDKQAGSSVTAHPDTCDSYGNLWDYNGIQPGTGGEGRFSLKLRAEKLNPYYDPNSDDPEKKKQYLDITDPKLRQRGLHDQFYKEYSYWVRKARIAKMPVRMELAQLLTIDKTVKATVGDITGLIRKMQYSVSNKTGLGTVTMEIMYI